MRTRMTSGERWVWLGVFLLTLSAPLSASFLGFFPWSPLNCWHYDVDINSGRIRYTRFFLFGQLAQRVEESSLSAALRSDDIAGQQPDWQRVHTLSPNVHNSPHYIFHAAMSQVRQLDLIWRIGNFTPAARRASAKRVLELWKQAQSDKGARPYLRALEGLASEADSAHKSIDERDLPAVP